MAQGPPQPPPVEGDSGQASIAPVEDLLLYLGIEAEVASTVGSLLPIAIVVVLLSILLGTASSRNTVFFLLNRVLISINKIANSFFGLNLEPSSNSSSLKLLQSIQNDISVIKSSQHSGKDSLDEATRAEIVGLFEKSLNGRFSEEINEQLQEVIERRFERNLEIESHHFFESSVGRIMQASSTVSIRGLLSLLIGIGFAGGALYILRQAVTELRPEFLATLSISTATYLIALRLSLAAFITLISYFFLSLYRASLLDNKYYQNEITNIAMVSTALHLAYSSDDKEAKHSLIAQIASNDRNKNLPMGKYNRTPNDIPIELVSKLIEKIPSTER